MKIFYRYSLILLSCLSFFGVATAAQQYHSGAGVSLSSDGNPGIFYNFGKMNLNRVELRAYHFTEQKSTIPADPDTKITYSSIPIGIYYTRLFQVSPQKFNNQLFFGLEAGYVNNLAGYKSGGENQRLHFWSDSLQSILEYRLNSQLAFGSRVALYQHAEEKDKNFRSIRNDVGNGSVYLSYQF
jgi:hypothetical protein